MTSAQWIQWLPVITGGSVLLGALVAAVSPVLLQHLRSKAERRQDRLRLAVQLALAEHEQRLEAMKEGLLSDGQRQLPLALYVDYHSRVLTALDHGLLTPDAMAQIHQEHTKVKARLDAMPPYQVPPSR